MNSIEQVHHGIERFFVRHPGFIRVEDEVLRLIRRGKSIDEADCLLITGPAGTGKSTLRKRMKTKFPAVPDGRRFEPAHIAGELKADHIPVLVVEMPSQPRPLAFVRELLRELGDPSPTTGRFDECCARLDDYLEACGTVSIIIDEVQRLVDNSGAVTSAAVLEELKRLHGKHGISLVFLGLGRIKYIFDGDVQLRDRWSMELRLDRFQCFEGIIARGEEIAQRNDDEFQYWSAVLGSLQDLSGLKSDYPLSAEDYATRLYYATAGILRRLKQLMKRALIHAIEDQITLSSLALAFADGAQNRALPNPFGPEYPDHVRLPLVPDDYALLGTSRQCKTLILAKAKAGAPVHFGNSIGAALERFGASQ